MYVIGIAACNDRSNFRISNFDFIQKTTLFLLYLIAYQILIIFNRLLNLIVFIKLYYL